MAKKENRQQLEFFGKKLALSGFFAKRVKLLGIDIPVAGIAIVAGLVLICLTVWGIVFTRAPKHITQQLEHRYQVSDPQFVRTMGVLLGPPLLEGNRAETLLNGDQIFPAMLTAIRGAKSTITFETYIYWSGKIGKVLVVDRLWTSVGSTNFDNRSFRLNDEANLNIHDREFALRQVADFENDLRKSRRISYDDWANRPWTEKLWEHFLALFGPQL